MEYLPNPPEGSELATWQSHDRGTYAGFTQLDEAFVLTVETDDPVHGHLIRLWTIDDGGRKDRVAQTVVEDRKIAITVAAEMAAAADDLAAVDERPTLGPETVYREDVDRDTVEAPEDWDDENEWREALDEAFEKAEIPRSKGTLTTKTIDDRDYYYLQWREGDSVKSEYVAPVTPAS